MKYNDCRDDIEQNIFIVHFTNGEKGVHCFECDTVFQKEDFDTEEAFEKYILIVEEVDSKRYEND